MAASKGIWPQVSCFAALCLGLLAFQCSAATLTVSTANDSGVGSLRQAMLDSNATNGLDTIVFAIPGSGAHTITPLSVLPPINDRVVIDGTTQPGYSGKPLIEINGGSAGSNPGLQLFAGNSTIRGLVINRFALDGIDIVGVGTNLIAGNFIGTDTNGTASRGNLREGIYISGSSGNIIGGTNPADRNLISGNSDAGIYLDADANTVLGNYIGTTLAGTARLRNTNNGIVVFGATGNLIGGTASGARNVISGNGGSGIYLFGPGTTNNLVQGNYIGTDFTGTLAVSNTADGITLTNAAFNTIGGTATGAGNLISGNGHIGVYLNGGGVTNNAVQGNYIGTVASGNAALANNLAGVTLAGCSNNLIGGQSAAARNVISGNKQDGVFLTTSSMGNTIAGNFVGVDVSGAIALANGFNGVSISSAHSNTIGGILAGAGNVLSGNGFYGIQVYSGSKGNVIQGNNVGTDWIGQSAVPNPQPGIRVESPYNTIGGTAPGAGNLISGNTLAGLLFIGSAASSNVVQGNYLGTTATGSAGLGNGGGGIGVSDARFNQIGGTAAGAGNVISANGSAGIYLIKVSGTCSGNLIQGNTIGADVTGSQALANSLDAITTDGCVSNTIGGSVAGAGNQLVASGFDGIYFHQAGWNIVQGNLIGTRADGVTALGSAGFGIECEVGATNNTIGGGVGAGNTIAFSQGSGVRVRTAFPSPLANRIVGNSIFSNGTSGIDLGVAGTTLNDHCDIDTGGNNLQNFPVLTQAVTGNGTGVRGTLDSAANSTFLLQFFASPVCDSSGYGEGMIYLGDETVTTGATCTNSFVATLPASVPVGYVITATATDAANNTSEFSACLATVSVPILRINLSSVSSNPFINLAWTNTVTGFALKQSSTLLPPIPWTPVTNVPVNLNGQFTVTLPAASVGNRFYLLNFE